jgi:hypothetical protein
MLITRKFWMKEIVLIHFLILLFASCDFIPEREVFTEIDKPTTAGLKIDLVNYPNSEIQLKQSTLFSYSIGTGGKKIIESKVIFNNQLIWVTSSEKGSFFIDPATLATGSYKLRIEFSAKSATGSLADKAGAEILYVWTERTIIIDREVRTISVTAVENKDNSIKISWNEYTNFNFQSYELIREDFDDKGKMISGRVFSKISNSKTTSLIDNQYLGGKSKYRLVVYAADKTSASADFEYEHPYKPNLTYIIDSKGKATVSWRSLSRLEANFFRYKLEVKPINDSDQTITFDLTNVRDTSVTFTLSDFRFGSSKSLKLTHLPYTDNYYSKTYFGKLNYSSSFPSFAQINFNTQNRKFYFTNYNYRLLSANEAGMLLDSIKTQYNGFVFNNEIAIATTSQGKNFRINLQTMQEEGAINLPEGAPFGLSNDGKIAFATPAGGKIFTLQGAELLAMGFQTNEGYAGISPNGKYVFFEPKLYRDNGNKYEIWGSWYSYGIKSVSFLPDEPSIIVLGMSNRIVKWNNETRFITSETTFTGPCNYDPVSNKLGCLNGDKFYILNSDNLLEYKSLKVKIGYDYYLLNSSILCSYGMQIKLSDIP